MAASGCPHRPSRKGSTVNEQLHVVCPRCNTTNRVRRERLDAGAKCGSCKESLLPGEATELTAEGFDRHVGGNDLPLVAFRGGREVARQSGAMDLPGLLRWVRTNV